MIRHLHRSSLHGLALGFALALAASAGDNAGARFSLTGAGEIAGIGPGETITVELAASGVAGAREIDVSLAVSPASAFDLAATAYEVPTGWIAPYPSSATGTDTVRVEDTDIFRATLTTSVHFTAGAEATVSVDRISIGPSSSERDEFDGNGLGMTITLNSTITAVEESTLPVPVTALAQNYPNPFNAVTNIRFELGVASSVTLTVYDAAGQVIRVLAAGEFLEAGSHSLTWDGRNKGGSLVGSGIYLCQLRADSFTSVKKMALLQ